MISQDDARELAEEAARTQAFIETGASRETSPEIMDAIDWLARSEAEAVRIWESPTGEEMPAVWERVTGNGLRDADCYHWGASGTQWMETRGGATG